MEREYQLSRKQVNKIKSTLRKRYNLDLFRSKGGTSKLIDAIFKLGREFFKKPFLTTEVQHIYEEIAREDLGMDANAARNSWAAVSGNRFQGIVKNFINTQLAALGIIAVTASELRQIAPHIIQFLTLPAKRRCTQSNIDVWPDNDLIILTRARNYNWRVFALLSCKTSFHARETESCFWALALRDTGLRLGMVTEDLHLELGTCKNPNKNRRLLEAYFDRVYSANPDTSMCSQIQPLELLYEDLLRWRKDLVSDALEQPIDLDALS
jgi:hypothetical protein